MGFTSSFKAAGYIGDDPGWPLGTDSYNHFYNGDKLYPKGSCVVNL